MIGSLKSGSLSFDPKRIAKGVTPNQILKNTSNRCDTRILVPTAGE